jgi:hypothetical protein
LSVSAAVFSLLFGPALFGPAEIESGRAKPTIKTNPTLTMLQNGMGPDLLVTKFDGKSVI